LKGTIIVKRIIGFKPIIVLSYPENGRRNQKKDEPECATGRLRRK
jgi:hypothetical protein